MGNDHSRPSLKTKKIKTKVSRSIHKRKLVKLQKSKLQHEKFFMAHHKSQQEKEGLNSNKFIQPHNTNLQKRVIFVSLMGLYQSWKRCPSQILYSSIFLLPLQKDWVYQKKRCYQHGFGRVLQDTEFLKLIRWKDAQGLVFWMKDKIALTTFNKTIASEPTQEISPLITPFWRYLSVKLSQIYDPITGTNYNNLLLNDNWWIQQYNGDVLYNDIKKELCFLTMKFKTISAILNQSNPSLNIVTVYTTNTEIESSQKSKSLCTFSDQKVNGIITPRPPIYANGENGNDNETNLDRTETGVGSSNEFIVDDDMITPDVEDPQGEDNSADNVWWVSTEYDDNFEENHQTP